MHQKLYLVAIVISFALIGAVLLSFASAGSNVVSLDFNDEQAIGSVEDDTASGNYFYKFVKKSDDVDPDPVTPEFWHNTFLNSQGLIADELNIASNGNWSLSDKITNDGAEEYSITVKIPKLGHDEPYYWSSTFAWSNSNTGGGYIGLQNKVNPIKGARGGIFSIWDTSTANAVDGGIAQPFGGEGVGMQTARGFDWLWDVEYDFTVERDAAKSNAQHNWWRGFIVNKTTLIGIEVGRIRTPAEWGYLVPKSTFIERIGGLNKCGNVGPATAYFSDLRPSLHSATYKPTGVSVEMRSYSDCKNIITSSIYEDGYKVSIGKGSN